MYLGFVGLVFFARRPNAFVPSLPEMAPNQTRAGEFNPYTAHEHLWAITTEPHPFSSRANTDIIKKYIRDQFKVLQAEAIAIGRRNVRYDDGTEGSTWTRLTKSQQQQRMEAQGETVPSEDEELQPELLEFVQGDNLVMWVGGVARSMEGHVPVDIEIDVDQESQTAMLVSAHYDSVATSYGQTDDGGGVAVILTLIRHFIHHPVQHTLIFHINNAEELGLYGASAFMGAPPHNTAETGTGHPWSKYIRAFVNLEGAASGGPSLLFRAANHDIIRFYAENAPFPHASVFSNDLFKSEIVARSMYHSITDDLPIESLYHMGANTQATIIGICNSDYLDSIRLSTGSPKEPSSTSVRSWLAGRSVFYDLLGKQMFFSELWTTLLVNALMLGLGLPVLTLTLLYIGRAINARQSNSNNSLNTSAHLAESNQTHSLRSAMGASTLSVSGYSDDGYSAVPSRINSSARQHGRQSETVEPALYRPPDKSTVMKTTALVAFIVTVDLVAVFAASRWMAHTNLFVRYSYPWVVLLGLGLLLLIVNTMAVYLCTVLESWIYGPVPIVRGATQWTLAIGVWWWIIVLTIGTGVAGWFGLGALYGTGALAAFTGAAALIQIALGHLNPTEGVDSTRFGWILVLAASLLVPGVIVLDLLVVVVYITSQSLIGPDNGIMYIIYGVFLVPLFVQAIPVVSRGRNFKTALALELLVLAGIAWWLSQAEEFTANAPGSLYFHQLYNQTAQTSYVDLYTETRKGYLDRILKDIPLNGTKCVSLSVDKDDYFQEMCRFVPDRQVFEDKGSTQPIRADWITVPPSSDHMDSKDGFREGMLQVLALESRYCTIQVSQTSPGHETQIWVEGLEAKDRERVDMPDARLNHRAKLVVVLTREWNRAWTVGVRVRESRSKEQQQQQLGQGPNKNVTRVPVVVNCAYNEWISEKGYASAYNGIRRHIPNWIRMKAVKAGIFTVSVDKEL
ncbi:hypothetical protein EDD11_005836 [Mortierella claussenii]|nr:hypothetical protein EDD11_005836 [Mortierella claussenii]